MEKRLLKDETGFTLIELMVVVAIIGVLSAIAVPNFKKYQAKAKQSEAKIQLAAVYASEVGSMADYDAFATCLLGIGYEWPQRGYYIIGFDVSQIAAVTATGRMPGANCSSDEVGGYTLVPQTAHLKAGRVTGVTTDIDLQGLTVADELNTSGNYIGEEADSFTAAAAGNIASTLRDRWTIDTTKKLYNEEVGYQFLNKSLALKARDFF